jgi:hypothetical protein
MLVTERPGRLRIVDNGKLLPPVTRTAKVLERQDAGMFDVEVPPQYEKAGWIDLSYAEPLPDYTPPPHASRRRRSAGAWIWRPASAAARHPVDDGPRARQDQCEERVGGRGVH